MTFSVDRLRNVSNINGGNIAGARGTYGRFAQRSCGRLGAFRGGNIDGHIGRIYHTCLQDKL